MYRRIVRVNRKGKVRVYCGSGPTFAVWKGEDKYHKLNKRIWKLVLLLLILFPNMSTIKICNEKKCWYCGLRSACGTSMCLKARNFRPAMNSCKSVPMPLQKRMTEWRGRALHKEVENGNGASSGLAVKVEVNVWSHFYDDYISRSLRPNRNRCLCNKPER